MMARIKSGVVLRTAKQDAGALTKVKQQSRVPMVGSIQNISQARLGKVEQEHLNSQWQHMQC